MNDFANERVKQLLEKSKEIHNNKYDYSKVEYVNNKTKVCIICPIHGEFWQLLGNHSRGQGCPECGKIKCRESKFMGTEIFIQRSIEKHGNKYDYSKTEYLGWRKKSIIICPIHGEFLQTPNAHLRGDGCPKCSHSYKLNEEDVINRFKEVHRR